MKKIYIKRTIYFYFFFYSEGFVKDVDYFFILKVRKRRRHTD